MAAVSNADEELWWPLQVSKKGWINGTFLS
jgi:hypothetical protein